jgi:hypothetical protein
MSILYINTTMSFGILDYTFQLDKLYSSDYLGSYFSLDFINLYETPSISVTLNPFSSK